MSSIKELKDKLKDVQEECEKYTNLYWGLFHKTKSGCDHYKEIIHKKDLRIMELERKLSIYEVKEYNGAISSVSQDNIYGVIECPDFENKITFHKNNCRNFILKKTKMIEKSVNFNLDFTHGTFQAINVKLKENNTNLNYLDMLDDFMESPEIFDNIQYNVEEKKENYKINPIFENCNIWYMNGYNTKNMDSVTNIWEHLIDNNFVYTWRGLCKDNITILNEKIHEKVLKGDKIAWYFPKRGYVSILEVKGEPRPPTDDELSVIKPTFNVKTIQDMKESFKKYSWSVLVIPVKFLAYTDKYKCITEKDIKWDDNCVWSGGFRGSSSIKPKSKNWKEQVSRMYDCMPYKN